MLHLHHLVRRLFTSSLWCFLTEQWLDLNSHCIPRGSLKKLTLPTLLKWKSIFWGKMYIHICIFNEIWYLFHEKRSIFKTYRSCINTHLKLLNFGEARKPPLSSAPNDHTSLSMTTARSPAHLASSCLWMQPALTLYFFSFGISMSFELVKGL